MDPKTLNNQALLIFFFLFFFALYTTWGLTYQNHTVAVMEANRAKGPHLLPNTAEPLRRHYTGVAPVDYQLAVLVLFFWELVDGSHPSGSLLCVYFAGQVATAMMLLMVQGLRPGRRATVLGYVNVWGFLAQNAAFAVVMPVYFLVEYSFYFTDSLPSPGNIFPDDAALLAVPFSVLVGYGLPLILLALPAPSMVDYQMKQVLMSCWQVFPLWIAIAQQGLTIILGSLDVKGKIRKLNLHRAVYLIAVLVALVTHVSTFAIMGLSSMIPELFAIEYRDAFTFSSVFWPSMLLQVSPVETIGRGAHLFLQYDLIVGSASMLLWGITSLSLTNAKLRDQTSMLGIVMIVILATLMTGPIGCAAVLFWIRDEKILAEGGIAQKGKKAQ